MLKNKKLDSCGLNIRETLVLKYVCQEKTNIEIAEKLELSLRQTEKVKKSLYTKTRTDNVLGLFKWAVRNEYYSIDRLLHSKAAINRRKNKRQL